MNVRKLEISGQFRRRFGLWVNPDLMSLRICTNGESIFLEYRLATNPYKREEFDLQYLNIEMDSPYEEDIRLFDACADIVDLAELFLNLDDYYLVNYTKNLFTTKAKEEFWISMYG